jgi:hypothetical protein
MPELTEQEKKAADAAYARNMGRCNLIGKAINRNPYDVMSAAIRTAQALRLLTGTVLQAWVDTLSAGGNVNIDQ